MPNDNSRLLELIAESLIRQDQLMELIERLRADHRILHDKFDTQDSNYSDLVRRLERIELRQDQQHQLLMQLLDIFTGGTSRKTGPTAANLHEGDPPRLLGE